MTRPYDRFILLAEMRTGSNLLQEQLDAIEGISCEGEVFNPLFVGAHGEGALLGMTRAERDADPEAMLRRLAAAASGKVWGFRFLLGHDPRVLAACLADPRCAKIVLSRDPLESYLSLAAAEATGQWLVRAVAKRRGARVHFDADSFRDALDARRAFHAEIAQVLQTSGQTAFVLDYDDIGTPEVIAGLGRFLTGVPVAPPAPLTPGPGRMRKQNPEALHRRVDNPEEMDEALAGARWLGRARTRFWEPRLATVEPRIVAALGAPVLGIIPHGIGPQEARLLDWLGRLARPGSRPGLHPKILQIALGAWLDRAGPGRRVALFVGHPLERAHRAFCRLILTGRRPLVRTHLNRQFDAAIPEDPAAAAAMDEGSHHDAFAAFLRFVYGNLSGQSAFGIDPAWAGQAAQAEALARLVLPDLVLRTETMAPALAFLAAEAGAPDPGLAPPPDVEPDAETRLLGLIWSPDLESLAAEAYAHDMGAFGFAPWRGRSHAARSAPQNPTVPERAPGKG